jgi:hypothetical protein
MLLINTEAMFSVGSAQSGYKELLGSRLSSRVGSEGSSFETPVCRNMSLGAEELNGVKSS